MKKKMFGVVVMAAIAVTAGWNMNQNENEVRLADLTLKNVEALATCVESWGGSCWWENNYNYCCHGGSMGCAPCD